MASQNILSSLGRAFGGATKTVAGAAKGTARTIGQGLAGIAGLGQVGGASTGAGAPLNQWTGQTRTVSGSPTSRYTPTPEGGGRYDVGPGRPAYVGGGSNSGGLSGRGAPPAAAIIAASRQRYKGRARAGP